MNGMERSLFVKNVLENLQFNDLRISEFEALKELFLILKNFKDNGGDFKGKIEFPEFNRNIFYKISDKNYKKSWVKMEKM